MAADLGEEGKVSRSDPKARKRRHGDWARELRHARGGTRVRCRRLRDEGLRGQEVDVARSPWLLA